MTHNTGIDVELSDEQNALIDHTLAGRDVIVDATAGSGKTTTIQALCNVVTDERPGTRILYLTYSKLLRIEAQAKITNADVHNYHSYAVQVLGHAGIRVGISDAVTVFNNRFDELVTRGLVTPRDILVIDEYQDIRDEFATMLTKLRGLNPATQVVLVGDMSQKVRDDTVLDAQEFALSFTTDPAFLPFTRSFRMGPAMAEKLGTAWNKPMVGANTGQKVSFMKESEAVALMVRMAAAGRHDDILCLGPRAGQMAKVLNTLEKGHGHLFNKTNTYASISEGGGSNNYGPGTAVFTTYDGSKGMERDTCFVFNYTEGFWDVRTGYTNQDPVIMRNIFLVAASRGKNHIVFVQPWRDQRTKQVPHPQPHGIGYIPMARLSSPGVKAKPVYDPDKPMAAGSMFGFVYAENIRACFNMLECTRLDDGHGDEIAVPESDALIDLSPVINVWQKAVFFSDFDTRREMWAHTVQAGDMFSELVDEMASTVHRARVTARLAQMRAETGREPSGEEVDRVRATTDREIDLATLPEWEQAKLVAAAVTNQRRYISQVDVRPSDELATALVHRIGTFVDRSVPSMVDAAIEGTLIDPDTGCTSQIMVRTALDATNEERNEIVSIRFASELGQPDFCTLAMQLCMMPTYDHGLLLNSRTGERWEVRVPDRQEFLDAAFTCATKQEYRKFEETEDMWF